MTVAGPTQTSANFATRDGVAKVSRPPDQRSIRKPPTTASSVLPSAMTAEVSSVPAVVALAAKAPIKIAGHMRRPPSSTAASAMPVGGQIGLALGLIEASCKPELGQHEIGERDDQQRRQVAALWRATPSHSLAGNFFNGVPLECPFCARYSRRAAHCTLFGDAESRVQSVTKRLAETGQTFPVLRPMLRQILSRGL